MLQFENQNKAANTPKNSNQESQFSEITKKNNSSSKEIHIEINNKEEIIHKNYTNQLFDGTTSIDESKSRSSFLKIRKKPRKTHSSKKCQKKEMNKLIKLLRKNKKLKIPTGKSMNNVNIYVKPKNKNNDDISKNIKKKESLPEKPVRLDSYGNKITKGNKKKVHIRFSDNIPENKLIHVIPIESFKKYNIIEKKPEPKNNSFSNKCCQIF
jgi:hypothetical protein